MLIAYAALPRRLRGLLEPRVLRGPVEWDIARAGDEIAKAVHRHVRDRLEQLLIAPTGLERILVVHARWSAVGLEQALDVGEQCTLALVGGLELPRQRDLVQAEPGIPSRALQRRQGIRRTLMLGHRKCDSLLRLQRQRAVAKLRAEARERAQSR